TPRPTARRRRLRTASRPNWPLNLSASCRCPRKRAWWSWETPPSTPRPSALPARNASLVGSCPSTPSGFLLERSHVPKVSSLSEDLTADQMVCLKVHPGKGKYVDYRRISRYRIGPKFKPRTYYVH